MQPITRSASAASAVSVPTPLMHPTPDLHSMHEGYFRNISTLEQKAEEMSQGGSDIGEEIKKMHEEQKSRGNSIRSRQGSIQSSHQGEADGVRGGAGAVLARMGSEKSRSSSSQRIVDVNGAARWGGYSPTGYVSSPVGSIQSGSWSQVSVPRKASVSGSSRLAQMLEPAQEGHPLDVPVHPIDSSPDLVEDMERSRVPSQSSFGQRYDEIAGQIEESLEGVPPSPPKHDAQMYHEGKEGQRLEGATTPPDRPRSADTFQEAELAFKDFDGVHFSPITEEFVELGEDGNEVRRVPARTSSGGLSLEAASMLRTPRPRPLSNFVPPPADGMLYYPAPVPRMLNLPKRLSQLPAASVQAKRRSHVLSQLPPGARESAPWLPELSFAGEARGHRSQGSQGSNNSAQRQPEPPRGMLNQRMSVANLHNLPPQLRASVFFDHQSVTHDVEVKSESAVATLDSILAASATAPVSAFTDHPYVGDVRKSTYAPERIAVRRSTATLAPTFAADMDNENKPARRRSSIANLLRRSSSGNELGEELKRTGSRNSLLMDFNEGGNKLRKRKSQMSIANDLDRQTDFVKTPDRAMSQADLRADLEDDEGEQHYGSRAPTRMSGQLRDEDGDGIEDDFREEEQREDASEGEPVYTQPTTLLAELQVRKAQQKSRNRTAATAFPNGMHSTLLQLDAVEEISKRKRQNKRVPLAWEDNGTSADERDEDDDVPLGMLFPAKNGAVNRKTGDDRDWDRPLGLMEKRELEDNEPLASRKNRLKGLPPSFGRAPSPDKRPTASMSQLHLAGQPDAPPEGKEEDEDETEQEGETLAQRLRRLKTKSVLDTAISNVAPGEGSRPVSTFTDDVLSQFGGLDAKEKKAEDSKTVEQQAPPPTEEEETLGQRRARLQREREASNGEAKESPNLSRNNSMSNLLATNPIGPQKASRDHKPAEGTLLHASAQYQAKQKAQILSTNIRSSSYYGGSGGGGDKSFVASRPYMPRAPGTTGFMGQQQQQNGFSALGGFAGGGTFNNGLGLQTSASTPMFHPGGMQQNGGGYFASPTAAAAAMPFGNPMMMGMPMPYQQSPAMMSPLAYQSFAAHRGGGGMAGYGFPNAATAAHGYGAFGGGGGAMGGGGMPFAGMADESLDDRQRAVIDQWRMSVMQ